MAAKPRVAFFLEDAAQEAIVPPLFKRLADEEGFDPGHFDFQVLSASGGDSLGAFRHFLKDAPKYGHLKADLLVVGSDANCKGFPVRRGLVLKEAEKSPYSEVIVAIPDPHIERWYLLDVKALAHAAGVKLSVSTPAYKCDKNHYKTLLRQAFTGTEVIPPLGGIEYGPQVAEAMDLYQAGKNDHGFAEFIENTRAWLKRLK